MYTFKDCKAADVTVTSVEPSVTGEADLIYHPVGWRAGPATHKDTSSSLGFNIIT